MNDWKLGGVARIFAAILCLIVPTGGFAEDETDEADVSARWFEQKAQVVPSQEVDSAANKSTVRGAEEGNWFDDGPPAHWIWGPQHVQEVFLKTTFETQTDRARIILACDNHVDLFLNGKRVARHGDWSNPLRMDLLRGLKAGRNELLARCRNDGGPAAFVCKVQLKEPDGKPQYVVTDHSWRWSPKRQANDWKPAETHGVVGAAPWGPVFRDQAIDLATSTVPRGVFRVPPGFQVELLYTVPQKTQGSWVSLTFDNQGRVLASDQGDKGIYRITPAPLGTSEPTRVEKLNLNLSSAQGLLYAFDSLYVSINGGPGSGLYRARDRDGDDQFEEVTRLKDLQGGGEHGPHALRLSPDGKSLYLIAGNHTDPPADAKASLVPSNWSEDLLLPRQWDARGHARGKLAPGGWIARVNPDATNWEIFSIGYRNPYDMDFNADGELFAYDADMEWDMGTSWYRPTRVVHATSGSEFGWRSGTGKWPNHFPDSLPTMVDIGPGSPVGVTFGYGARFPARYQKALFILDWTFGTMYSIHLKAQGASYTATKEEFVARAPLPLTDAAVGPDGALYFTIGGRGTQSELYRVTYAGSESTNPVDGRDETFRSLREVRARLEQYHRPAEHAAEAVDFIYAHLGNSDRHIRYAARVALEHQPISLWQSRVLQETMPEALISGAIALARQADSAQRDALLDALDRLNWKELSLHQQLSLLRAYALTFIRLGRPDPIHAGKLAARLDPHYPAGDVRLDRELCRLLVYLESTKVIDRTLALMEEVPQDPAGNVVPELLTRNEQYGGTIANIIANHPETQNVHYALMLRNVRYGWTLEQRKAFLAWLDKARTWDGGASYKGFIDNIRKEALANALPSELAALDPEVKAAPVDKTVLPQPMGPGREWAVPDLQQLTANGLAGRKFENGKRAYAAARCVVCHRFAGEGGATGPDLTNVAGRFSIKDLAESIIHPSKVVSDQYRAMDVVTTDGKVYSGRVLSGGEEGNDGDITVLTDPEDATELVSVAKSDIEEMKPSQTSLMPAGLLNPLNRAEVLDLLAFLMSRGNAQDAMFARRN